MKPEEKEFLGVGLIEKGCSPLSGEVVNPRSYKWWRLHNMDRFHCETLHENEQYQEVAVRFLIKKSPDERGSLHPRIRSEVNRLIKKREEKLKALKKNV